LGPRVLRCETYTDYDVDVRVEEGGRNEFPVCETTRLETWNKW